MTEADTEPVILARDGLPTAGIRTPSEPSPAIEYAAEELRRHLHVMLGLPPAVRREPRSPSKAVYVGDADAARAAGIDVASLNLGPEDFRLETRGGNLYVLGGGDRGVLYGVYELLETLGCRWYTTDVSTIPKCREVELPAMRRTGRPAFEFRDVFCWEGGDPTWWGRNRLNGNYTPVPDYMGGHVSYGLHVHTFFRLVPPGEFFADHPEYYSLIDGRRRWEKGQLCLSNPEVLRIAIERVIEHMERNPRATIFSVSQQDWEGYCECDECTAIAEAEGSQAGPVIRFVNAVAEQTSKRFPDKLIDTIAYMYTLDAPRTPPHPNVRVRMCPIRCCQGHPFGQCDHPESLRALKGLEEWGRLTDRIYIWHYCTNFSNYPLPMPDFDELAGNVRIYVDHGVRGVFMQGMGQDGGGAESMELRGWVLSRLLWDPTRDVWALVDEFLDAVYGSAAGAVRDYLDLFHRRVREDRSVHPLLYDPPTAPLFDGDILDQAESVLAGGEDKVRGRRRMRVRLLRNGVRYARLGRIEGLFRLDGDVFRSPASREDVKLWDAMIRDWKKAGVEYIREGEPLDVTAGKIRNRLADHDVKRAAGEGMEIAVVPDLGGRILHLTAGGRQWLTEPDPDNPFQLYPMSEGYCESLITGPFSYRGWGEPCRSRALRDGIRVYFDAPEGLRLTRTYRLREGALRIVSRIENAGDAPRSTAWGGSLHLLAPGAAVTFSASDGPRGIEWDDLDDGLGAARTLDGDKLPDGEWRAEVDGFRVVHRFDGPVTRAIVGKVTDKGTLALDLRTETASIAPGDAVEIRQEIRVGRV